MILLFDVKRLYLTDFGAHYNGGVASWLINISTSLCFNLSQNDWSVYKAKEVCDCRS